jgi:hypothetical protein
MCPNLLGDSRLYVLLLKCDLDLASETKAAGCACGGVLHSARYERKPRGATAGLPAGYDRRESFCCAADGCRKRMTPPSVRFLGSKVYLGAVVALISALRHGPTARRVAELQRAIGASRRTLARWRTWWTEVFTTTPFWRAARALVPGALSSELPSSLLASFVESDDVKRLYRLLDFIKPVTTRSGGRKSMAA